MTCSFSFPLLAPPPPPPLFCLLPWRPTLFLVEQQTAMSGSTSSCSSSSSSSGMLAAVMRTAFNSAMEVCDTCHVKGAPKYTCNFCGSKLCGDCRGPGSATYASGQEYSFCRVSKWSGPCVTWYRKQGLGPRCQWIGCTNMKPGHTECRFCDKILCNDHVYAHAGGGGSYCARPPGVIDCCYTLEEKRIELLKADEKKKKEEEERRVGLIKAERTRARSKRYRDRKKKAKEADAVDGHEYDQTSPSYSPYSYARPPSPPRSDDDDGYRPIPGCQDCSIRGQDACDTHSSRASLPSSSSSSYSSTSSLSSIDTSNRKGTNVYEAFGITLIPLMHDNGEEAAEEEKGKRQRSNGDKEDNPRSPPPLPLWHPSTAPSIQPLRPRVEG